jgi:SAM-dependent methyltransferase
MRNRWDESLQTALKNSADAGILFENASVYNKELEFTYRRTIHDISQLEDTNHILEIGCFTGVIALALKSLGYQITASDMPFVLEDPGVSKMFLSNCVDRLPANLADYPFPARSESFDLIIFNEVIEHLNFNPIPLLREFHRILRKNGRIYCATPNLLSAKNRFLLLSGKSFGNPIQHLIRNLDPTSSMQIGLHWREYSKEELIQLFEYCNFKVERHNFGLVTPNRSKVFRKTLVAAMYRIAPWLMPNQVILSRKRV